MSGYAQWAEWTPEDAGQFDGNFDRVPGIAVALMASGADAPRPARVGSRPGGDNGG